MGRQSLNGDQYDEDDVPVMVHMRRCVASRDAEIATLREQLAAKDAELRKARSNHSKTKQTAEALIAVGNKDLAAKDAEIARLRELLVACEEDYRNASLAFSTGDNRGAYLCGKADVISQALANSNPSAVMDALRAAKRVRKCFDAFKDAETALINGDDDDAGNHEQVAHLEGLLNQAHQELDSVLDNLPPHFKAALEGK